ncbi:MAG: ATP-dependent DNA helicase, partial [archaeon]|nr:ATP-dependent DNA helicase [archaeon]
ENDSCPYYKKMFKKGGDLSSTCNLAMDFLKRNIMTSEDAKQVCSEKGLCTYEVLMLYLKEANIIIADYYHMFHPFVQKMFFSKSEKDMNDIILIIDEAHNVPGRVRELLSSKLSNELLERAIKESEKFNFKNIYNDLKFLLKELQSYCIKHTEKKDENIIKKNDLLNIVKSISSDFNQFINELIIAGDIVTNERKMSYIESVGRFLMNWCGPENGFVRIAKIKKNITGINGFEICYDCLDPSRLTQELFEKLHTTVLMSGTLMPVDMFQQILGLNDERTEKLVLESPFPKENRLILIKDNVTTRYTDRGEDQNYKITGNIVKVLNNIAGNVGIFFPSYNMMNSIYELTSQSIIDKKIILEQQAMSKDEKKKLFDTFADHAKKGNGAALFAVMGANFSEGVDFPGELMNAVVVVGLPLERPDIKNQSLINYYETRFQKGWEYGYIYPAMNKVMQTAGRCIRSEMDRGVIVLMDKRFLWSTYKSLLPRDAQMYISGNLSAELQEFFRI